MSECGDQWLACMITGLFAGVTFAGLTAWGVRYIYGRCSKPRLRPAAVEVIVSPFAGAALGVSAAAVVSGVSEPASADDPQLVLP